MNAAQDISVSAASTGDLIAMETSPADLEAVVEAADRAFGPFSTSTPGVRISLLESLADEVLDNIDDLVQVAMDETALDEVRLRGEVMRNVSELRFFADVVREGSYLEASIDSADSTATPPIPEMRRYLRSRGPALIYAASNFPFAFGTVGCDAAAALASGSPIVIKSHPAHPRLARALTDLVSQVVRKAPVPVGTFGIIYGDGAGIAALRDPRIKACAFTGSAQAGTLLAGIASSRPEPIPFYGEFGSINPVVVTPAAERTRADDLARSFVGSFTDSVGQKCTKPGLLFVPLNGSLPERIAAYVRATPSRRMLTTRVALRFDERSAALAGRHDVESLVESIRRTERDASWQGAALYCTSTDAVVADPEGILQEHFGPSATLVTYQGKADLAAAVSALPGSLTGGIQGVPDDAEEFAEVIDQLTNRVGRFIWNDWPPGLAINWSQHHGGPWPATTDPGHTSVGSTSIRRWLRPIAFQSVPDSLLPQPLRVDNPWGVPQRLNGKLVQP